MSLIQQIRIAIFIVIVTVASGCLILGAFDSQHYLTEQLQKKNNDNANAIALSITQLQKDQTTIELIISAQFDVGNYRYIGIIDPNNVPIVERVNLESRSIAPEWFAKLLPIQVNPGYAIIQSGWKQFGTLQVESDINQAYDQLWHTLKNTFLWVALVSVATYLLCGLLLKKILRPLNDVIEQAKAIGERRYIITEEPNTKEFKTLVTEMNTLSERVKHIASEESARLNTLNMQINYDETTQLMNQSYFHNAVSAQLKDEQFSEGALWLIQLSNLADIDKEIGYTHTNTLIKKMSEIILSTTSQHEGMLCGRLSGSQFGIFSKQTIDDIAFANTLKLALSRLSQEAKPPQLIIVNTKAKKFDDLDDLLRVIYFILDLSNVSSPQPIRVMNANSIVSSKKDYLNQWGNHFNTAIVRKQIRLEKFPVLHHNGSVIHFESPLRLQLEQDGPWLSAGSFIDWATQLDLIKTLDLMALEYAIAHIDEHEDAISLNVSESAMRSPEYITTVTKLIQQLKQPQRLSFEVTEQAAFQHFQAFKHFAQQLKSLGCKVGIEHICIQLSRLGELHEIGLDYVKFDASLIRDIHQHPQQQTLMRGLCMVVRAMGIQAIAEGVTLVEEIDTIKTIGMDGITGPAIR